MCVPGAILALYRFIPSPPALPPPPPQHLPHRHHLLNGARLRQRVPLHPACLMRLPVCVRDVMRRKHRQAALVLGKLRAVERAVEFRRIGSPGHDGQNIMFAFPSPFVQQMNTGDRAGGRSSAEQARSFPDLWSLHFVFAGLTVRLHIPNARFRAGRMGLRRRV
jgi:hypothetical protein